MGKNASLSKISITPQITNLSLSSTQKFSAQGFDADNNTFPTNIIWSITSGTGTIAANGLFTASSTGTVTIQATDGLINSTLTFNVEDTTNNKCNATAINGQYTYDVTNTANPTITFIPTIPTTGNGICILYYSKNAAGPFNGYNVTPNIPYRITATIGETIYFYYTYSVATGGENTTLNNKHTVTVGGCDSLNIKNNELKNAIIVYPNPTHGKDLKITGEIENSEILMYSLNGALLKSLTTNEENELSIDTNNLARGFYILKIINKSSREVKTVKVEVF